MRSIPAVKRRIELDHVGAWIEQHICCSISSSLRRREPPGIASSPTQTRKPGCPMVGSSKSLAGANPESTRRTPEERELEAVAGAVELCGADRLA